MKLYRPDYKCPDCKDGTMKYKAEFFARDYTLGEMYCDNKTCCNSYENRHRFINKFNKDQGGK